MEVRPKNILYQFIKGETHFGMPRGAKQVWPSMNQHKLLFIHFQILHLACATNKKNFF